MLGAEPSLAELETYGVGAMVPQTSGAKGGRLSADRKKPAPETCSSGREVIEIQPLTSGWSEKPPS